MKGYVIVDVNITNKEIFDQYRSKVGSTIINFRGKVIVVTGGGSSSNVDFKEGDWKPPHLVIVEFESFERAQEWYESSEYQEISKIRRQSSESSFVFAQGLPHE